MNAEDFHIDVQRWRFANSWWKTETATQLAQQTIARARIMRRLLAFFAARTPNGSRSVGTSGGKEILSILAAVSMVRIKNRLEQRRWIYLLLMLLTLHVDQLCMAEEEIESWPLGRSGENTLQLKIPRGYGGANRAAEALDTSVYGGANKPPTGQIHKELLLTALWPGLLPDNGSNHAAFNERGGGRLMMALLDSGAVEDFEQKKYNALQTAFDVQLQFSTQMLCVPLPTEPPYADPKIKPKCYVRDRADTKPSKFGLERLGVDFSKYPDMTSRLRYAQDQNDIFYRRGSNGELTVAIFCMAEEALTVDDGPQNHMVAQCTHDFVDKKLNALVSIGYRRIYLRDWADIQRAWEQMLDSFIVDQTHIKSKEVK